MRAVELGAEAISGLRRDPNADARLGRRVPTLNVDRQLLWLTALTVMIETSPAHAS